MLPLLMAVSSLALGQVHAGASTAGDAGAGFGTDAALASIKPAAIRAEMRFLADDLLEGRGTGARGHLLAAHYLASQFEAMGLEPAGDAGSYFQQVPLRSARVDESASGGTLSRAGSSMPLTLREDFLLSSDPGRHDVDVEAPIVFVGYGVTAPSQGYDDYKNMDVKGKIVATIFGAPNFPSAVKAHYSAGWLKRQNAAAHGAVGLLTFYDPRLEELYAFKNQVRDLAIPRLNWLDAAGPPNNYYPTLKVVGTLSMPGVERILAGSGRNAAEFFAAAQAGKPQRFALAQSGHFHTVTEWTDIKSPNVVGKLEGSDPGRNAEYVVYTAHLDHLGISTPVDGDAIYNGALDNASGSAVLIEVARALAGMPTKPKRSFLFVAVTGEEAGLIGSDYFATNPPVPKDHIIANINMDEDVMLWPLEDIVAFGAEHSTLKSVVDRATARLHLESSPDPAPEQVAFIRSDQYSFVRQGIPSIALSAGVKSNDPNIHPLALYLDWERTTYHQPRDDMQQPGLDFTAAAAYARVALLCGLLTADDAAVPQWNTGDFFGAAYPRPPMAAAETPAP
jgi:hypothetical protein